MISIGDRHVKHKNAVNMLIFRLNHKKGIKFTNTLFYTNPNVPTFTDRKKLVKQNTRLNIECLSFTNLPIA